jgi:hypothetical protein
VEISSYRQLDGKTERKQEHPVHLILFRVVRCGISIWQGAVQDQGLGGRIILKWLLRNGMACCGLDSPGPCYGQVAFYCEHGNLHKMWGISQQSVVCLAVNRT